MVLNSAPNEIKNIHIAASLKKHLFELPSDQINARLYGVKEYNTIYLIAVVIDNSNNFAIPTGLCDFAGFTTAKLTDDSFESLKKNIPKYQDNGGVYVVCNDNKLIVFNDEVIVEYVTNDNDFSDLLLFRIKDNLPLSIDFSTDRYLLENNIQEAFDTLTKLITKDKLLFMCSQPSLIVPDDAQVDKNLEDIFIDPSYKKPKRKTFGLNQRLIDFKLLLRFAEYQPEAVCVPIIEHQHRQFVNYQIMLKIDTLTYLPSSSGQEELYSALLSSLNRTLSFAKFELIRSIRDPITSLVSLKTYHFNVGAHFLSFLYPDEFDEQSLEKLRRDYHKKYLLPDGRPLLRKSCATKLFEGQRCNGLLLNPHVGLSPSQVTGGRTSLVKGVYAYHHYMQDGKDDSGWGCAYRSLQTLVSWYRLQGYTEVEVPTHSEIQKTLVKIGDKPAKFLNSKQWIGSTEVCYVLDEMFKITSKILYVNSGEDMPMEGRKLANHFDTIGSPIMIGGGVLAHTILGVDFNQETGAIKFLILDPHYTGSESLDTVQDKGWCGWKTDKFWDKNAHYNLCMPQLPDIM